jgi:hypothetical protein
MEVDTDADAAESSGRSKKVLFLLLLSRHASCVELWLSFTGSYF